MKTTPLLQDALHRAVGLENDGALFEAEQIFRQLIQRANAPDQTHYQYGQFLLRRGDYQQGWQHFMKRLDDTVYRERASATLTKPYLAEIASAPVSDKTVLVYCDQGIGDAIMCARYIPLLAARASRVVLTVFQGFRELFSSLSRIENVDIIEFGDPLPDFDLHADLFSLPALFETTLETIPPAAWLRADPAQTAAWQSRLPAGRLRIGLAWQGNAQHSRDAERSARLVDLAPLFETGHTFVSLQAGQGLEQIEALNDPSRLMRFDEIESGIYEKTARMINCAALIDCLDLVITVDSAMAHLSGALGKPFWVLASKIPYWVFMLEGARTPWYPEARVFRAKERYKWDTEVADMVRLLKTDKPLAG
ncbi:MAG: glycosyltransferase family 9 protein [Rhodospirillales bacterium]